MHTGQKKHTRFATGFHTFSIADTAGGIGHARVFCRIACVHRQRDGRCPLCARARRLGATAFLQAIVGHCGVAVHVRGGSGDVRVRGHALGRKHGAGGEGAAALVQTLYHIVSVGTQISR